MLFKFFVMRVSVCVTKYTAKIGATHPAHAPGAALARRAASFGFAKGKTGAFVYIATVGTASPLRKQLRPCRQLELLRRCPRRHRNARVHDLVCRWEMLGVQVLGWDRLLACVCLYNSKQRHPP